MTQKEYAAIIEILVSERPTNMASPAASIWKERVGKFAAAFAELDKRFNSGLFVQICYQQ